jgi:hypothetical protein
MVAEACAPHGDDCGVGVHDSAHCSAGIFVAVVPAVREGVPEFLHLLRAEGFWLDSRVMVEDGGEYLLLTAGLSESEHFKPIDAD